MLKPKRILQSVVYLDGTGTEVNLAAEETPVTHWCIRGRAPMLPNARSLHPNLELGLSCIQRANCPQSSEIKDMLIQQKAFNEKSCVSEESSGTLATGLDLIETGGV